MIPHDVAHCEGRSLPHREEVSHWDIAEPDCIGCKRYTTASFHVGEIARIVWIAAPQETPCPERLPA
jgi:hypothetical protein